MFHVFFHVSSPCLWNTVCQMFHGTCLVLPMFSGAQALRARATGMAEISYSKQVDIFLWCIFSGWFSKTPWNIWKSQIFLIVWCCLICCKKHFVVPGRSFFMNQGAGISIKNTTGHGGTKLWVKRCLLDIIGHIYIIIYIYTIWTIYVKPSINGPFSMVMLNNQRVYIIWGEKESPTVNFVQTLTLLSPQDAAMMLGSECSRVWPSLNLD